MIAEESGSFSGITKPVFEGGLGFNLKWNMGFANDFYDYVQTDPFFRKYNHKALNFPLMYAFSENYILPISHDEVVHGKKSFIDKMFGSVEDKFLGARLSFLLMMSYPGKKLTFMGTEYGQFREWDYDNSLEWFMLDFPRHRHMQEFISELNGFYLENKELWEIDNSWDGYEWINANDGDANVISYKRKAVDNSELIVVINFSPIKRERYHIDVGESGEYEEVFSSDKESFGGNNFLNEKSIKTSKYTNKDGKEQNYLNINLPALSGVIIRKVKGGVRRDSVCLKRKNA